MAILTEMPAQDVIDGYRHVLDFYRWCGLTIVRKWPRYPGRHSSPQMKASQTTFKYVNQMASELPANVIATWKELAGQGGLTWKDWLNRCFISGTFKGKNRPTD